LPALRGLGNISGLSLLIYQGWDVLAKHASVAMFEHHPNQEMIIDKMAHNYPM
jgi:hypothetical protein